jgi:hypothetical protein
MENMTYYSVSDIFAQSAWLTKCHPVSDSVDSSIQPLALSVIGSILRKEDHSRLLITIKIRHKISTHSRLHIIVIAGGLIL